MTARPEPDWDHILTWPQIGTPAPIPHKDRGISDGDTLTLGETTVRFVATPGHTPGSTSLIIDDKFICTGDTIMKTSIGRPDLGGMVEEWAKLLYNTLFEKFSSQPDSLTVLPTHAASIREQVPGADLEVMEVERGIGPPGRSLSVAEHRVESAPDRPAALTGSGSV